MKKWVFSIIVLSFFATTTCWAGGSLPWTQIQSEIAKEDPFLADYIAKNFEVSPVGGGTRVGHDKDGDSLVPGMEVGARIPPYEFQAKPSGASGGYTLVLTFDRGSIGKDNTTVWLLTLRKRLPYE